MDDPIEQQHIRYLSLVPVDIQPISLEEYRGLTEGERQMFIDMHEHGEPQSVAKWYQKFWAQRDYWTQQKAATITPDEGATLLAQEIARQLRARR
jgi:hypothetical protein